VQLQTVEHAVFNINPDEVGLGRGQHLGDKNAGDSMGDTEQRLGRVRHCVLERLTQIARVGEHGSAVRRIRVQRRLLIVGLSFHDGRCVLDIFQRSCSTEGVDGEVFNLKTGSFNVAFYTGPAGSIYSVDPMKISYIWCAHRLPLTIHGPRDMFGPTEWR
jgi:hypothetical protein